MDVEGHGLFAQTVYWLSNTLPNGVRSQLKLLLDEQGASACPLKDSVGPSDNAAARESSLARVDTAALTHVITDNWYFPQRTQLPEQVDLVTPHWVTRSVDLAQLQDPRFYSPDPRKLLSGLCISTTELPPKDSEWVWNIVALLGGQYRESLTKEVTHLLAGRDHGQKYHMAETHGKPLGMKMVLPQWLYDTFQTRALQPTRVYAWPNPLLYAVASGQHTAQSANEQPIEDPDSVNSRTHEILGGFEPRRAIYDELKAEDPTLVKLLHSADANTVKQEVHLPDFLRDDASAPNGDTDVASPPKVLDSDQQAFAGLSFYIASDVPISNVVSAAVTKRLQEGGAADVFVASMHMKPTSTHRMQKDDSAQVKGAYEQAWEKKLAQADYVVCKERSGWEYWLASEKQKPIGTLLWLLSCMVSGKLDSPNNFIFHYPHPSRPIEGMDKVQMTITNYTSVKRELLKRLVELMGGKVSGEMNRQTKYVIAARKEGKKVQSAIQWNTPVLNHKWLTECCARWNLVDPVNYEPGRTFPPGLDYQNNMISDLPQDAVAVWAESSLAMESKKQASEFLEYARAQTKKTQNPVPESLDISDTGSESEASAMNGDVSGRSNTLRPTGSTPAHIQDQLVPREKSSSKKLSPFKSSPAVFDSENSGKKANKASKVKPTPKGRTSIAKKPALSDDDEADELPSRIHSSGNKRAAAVAGADKNRVNALDMNAHEKEKKRKRFQEIDGLPSEEEPPTSSKKPRGTRKASSSDDSSAENDLSAAPTYTSKNGKQNFSKKSVSKEPPTTSQGSSKKPTSKKIKFLQTGHHMEEDLIKGFEQLGAKKVDDPLTCTHVISDRILRTSKFLCALSRGPHIVTVNWIKDSVKRGKILPPEGYELKDKKGEKEKKMVLAESLKRARDSDGGIFRGFTFFFTKSIQPPTDLLKPIIEANGGKISKAKPTTNNMLPRKHDQVLVSSQDDENIWDDLVASDPNFPVHNGEGILSSILKQSFDPTGV